MMRRFLALLDTPAGRAARYAFSALVVAALVVSIDWRQFAGLHGKFDLGPVVIATLVAGLTFPLHAWRWWILLRAQGVTLSLSWAHVVTWIGNFYNAFLLGGLGGDAARAFYVCRDAPDRQAAGLAATLLDRVTGLVVLLSLAALTLLLKLETVARHGELRLLLALCAALSVASVIAFVFLCRRPPPWLTRWLGPTRFATLGDILERARATPGTLLAALASSYVIWLLDFLSVWLLARSLGLPLPFIEVSLAMSVAYAATVLPVSVGGHGIREGALLGMLALRGLLPDDSARQHALLLAVLVWAVSVLWSLAGGVFLLLARRRP
ncbi:MAG: lysylphosphatidylglycerol synthase transmembrane domain-containing protein [Verrucomicrobia bacterium]|nr:lysylphosphatidylglycerol synthase transmembrane domain-containing protein [Verrucomicrobiota bacterium]